MALRDFHTPKEEEYKYCYYCLRPFSSILKRTIDHIIPTSKGGTNDISNKVSSCRDCNSWKSDLSILEFLTLVENRLYKNKTPKFKNYTRLNLQNIINALKGQL